MCDTMGTGATYLNSFHDYAIAVGSKIIGIFALYVGVSILILGLALLYLKYYLELKNMGGEAIQ